MQAVLADLVPKYAKPPSHHQFILDSASQLQCCFMYGQGRYAFRVLPFGVSSAVAIVQDLMGVALDYCRIRYGIFALHYSGWSATRIKNCN